MDESKRIAANAPRIEGLTYTERKKTNVFTKNAPSVEFNIRNNYVPVPLFGVLPFVSKLWFAQGDQGNDVVANFHQDISAMVQKIKESSTIDLWMHGYNVNQKSSLRFREKMTENLRVKQNYRNLNAGISWSSDMGNNFIMKMLYFKRSVESADMSWPAFKTVETFLKTINPEIKINATTYSLGIRPSLNAANNGVKFGTVIAILPAIDRNSFNPGGEFEKALENIDRLIIVYSRRQEFIFGFMYRITMFSTSIGQYGPPKGFSHPKITFIDGTREKYNGLQLNIKNHFDYHDPETIKLIADYLRGIK